MKKLLLLSISLIMISGCSNGISPQEKRNNFDACVIEEMIRLRDANIKALISKDRTDELWAKQTCKELLK